MYHAYIILWPAVRKEPFETSVRNYNSVQYQVKIFQCECVNVNKIANAAECSEIFPENGQNPVPW